LGQQLWLPLLLAALAFVSLADAARVSLRKAIPTYNLPIRGVSPYNNHDPFNPAGPVQNIETWLVRHRERELLTSPGFQVNPMLLPPAPSIANLPDVAKAPMFWAEPA